MKKKRGTVAVELVVRRGAIRRFHKLKQKTASLPVEVSWDRRLGDRRTASDEPSTDRRRTDRRQKPPFTWETGDFVIASKTGQRSGK